MSTGRLSNNTQHRSWRLPLFVVLLTPIYYLVPWHRMGDIGAALGIAFLTVYVVLLPGAAISMRLHPNRNDFLEYLARSALFGLAFFLVVAFAWTLSGTMLGTFRLVFPAALILVTGLCAVPRPAPKLGGGVPPGGSDRFILAAFAFLLVWVFVLVLRTGIPIGFTADTLDHVGYVAEIRDTQTAFPTTAFYLDPGPNGEDLRKGLLHVFYGFGTAYTGAGTLTFLNGINAFLAVVLLLAVYAAGLMLFESRAIAVLAAVLFLIGVDEGLRGTVIRQSFYSHRLPCPTPARRCRASMTRAFMPTSKEHRRIPLQAPDTGARQPPGG